MYSPIRRVFFLSHDMLICLQGKKAAKWVVHCRKKKFLPSFRFFFLERFRHFSLTPDMFSRLRYCYGIAAIRRTRGSPTFLLTTSLLKKSLAAVSFLDFVLQAFQKLSLNVKVSLVTYGSLHVSSAV